MIPEDSELPQLNSPELQERIDRMQRVLTFAAKRMEEQSVQKTIVFFGSSRITHFDKSQEHMKQLEASFPKDQRRTDDFWQALDIATNSVYMSRYYDDAEELAYQFSEWSKQFEAKEDRYYVCSGGGPGIMQATNRGASRANRRSVGFGISILEEQDRNEYIPLELKFVFDDFFIRKFCFFSYAKAIIVFPGGLGTLDEFFEIITLIKTQKIDPMPIVLFGREYWENVITFDTMVNYNTIAPEDVNLFKCCDSVEETFQYIIEQLEG